MSLRAEFQLIEISNQNQTTNRSRMTSVSVPQNLNKGGRPSLWFLPTKTVRLPEKYIPALLEIAKEWQENEHQATK